jgi:hypothetical protein
MKDYKLQSGLAVTDFEVENIQDWDAPDYVDAYIYQANVCEDGVWRDATELELDELNEDLDLVYSCVQHHLGTPFYGGWDDVYNSIDE